VTEALSSIRPPEERAVEAAEIGSAQAHERPTNGPGARVRIRHRVESDSHELLMKAGASRKASHRSATKLRCSFCRAELDESLELTIPGSGKHGQHASTGSFCSTHCRNCVLALAALHPSPLASYDFISRRGLLTDRLLDLWRQGRGPDPGLVLEAAKSAGCGLAAPAPAL